MRYLAAATVMLVCAGTVAEAQEGQGASEQPSPQDMALANELAQADSPQAGPPDTEFDLEDAPPEQTAASDAIVINDPFEGFNRKMFAFNSVVDKYVLAPAAIAYAKATPRRLRRGISNALDNVSAPVTFGNDILQLKFKRAGVTLGRIVINSTIGIGGFFDVANKIGLEKHQEDFGQTIASYGAPSGPYLFLPFFGPSSVRDAFAQPVDIAMDPFSWTQFAGFRALRWSRVGVGALDARAEALRPLAEIRSTSPDPYVTIRTLYSLSRRSAIADGRQDMDALPEFGDPLEFDGEEDSAVAPDAYEAEPQEPTPIDEITLSALSVESLDLESLEARLLPPGL